MKRREARFWEIPEPKKGGNWFFPKEEGESRPMKTMFNISMDQVIIQCRNCLFLPPAETEPFQEESADS